MYVCVCVYVCENYDEHKYLPITNVIKLKYMY